MKREGCPNLICIIVCIVILAGCVTGLAGTLTYTGWHEKVWTMCYPVSYTAEVAICDANCGWFWIFGCPRPVSGLVTFEYLLGNVNTTITYTMECGDSKAGVLAQAKQDFPLGIGIPCAYRPNPDGYLITFFPDGIPYDQLITMIVGWSVGGGMLIIVIILMLIACCVNREPKYQSLKEIQVNKL